MDLQDVDVRAETLGGFLDSVEDVLAGEAGHVEHFAVVVGRGLGLEA